LVKSYRKAQLSIPVLRGVDLDVPDGQFCAIAGQSGSGKSTMLHLLATLDAPDAGEVYYRDERIDNLPPRGRDLLRNRHFGIIFQFYHLLPELSTLENVLLPAMIMDSTWSFCSRKRVLYERAHQLIGDVGLAHRWRHKPQELSGGEMQRVAIARALMLDPQVLFADEPTGNLDQNTGQEIMETLHRLNQRHGLTIVMVTHDVSVAAHADRVVRLSEGRIESRET
jgi:lipoprotein-releasing system ATP-binding protein